MRVIHAALAVESLERSLEFYVDGLGLTDRWGFERHGVRHRYLGGDGGAEIQLVFNPEVDVSAGNEVDHVALEVADVGETFETLTERTTCPVVTPPNELDTDGVESRYAFVEDPDGHLVELVERSADHPANEWR